MMNATPTLTSTTKEKEPLIAVCALYKFVSLNNFEELQPLILANLKKNQIKGTLLLAHEGINGTIAGTQSDINAFLTYLREDERLANIDYKISYHQKRPFYRTKVKLKKEIVTMGLPEIDPNKVVGTYVDPDGWNDIISDPQTVLIDTRNEYEVEIGTFKNAINPHTDTFREFPEYVSDHFDPTKDKKVAMFCTGGIRCEKASAYMKEQGFDQVYHLKGGILKYLEEVPSEQSLWQGECFVFDDRVAVNHDLQKGQYDQCHACRFPITEEGKSSPHYQQGVSCPRCYETLTQEQKQRFSEREKQVQLAKQRGEEHIGEQSKLIAEQHRLVKLAEKKKQRKQTT